jgi:uncharacterized protein
MTHERRAERAADESRAVNLGQPSSWLARDLTVSNGDVSLAGSLWLPRGTPTATVYMHPGSGPSDRDNDVYFPPIREHLLASGFAVSSFDKRGVGGSSGRWEDAAIDEQAGDALAAVDALLEAVGPPVGLYGHSQGGWVAVEAAGRGGPASFVIASSGPGVTPAAQERYSALMYLRRKGLAEDVVEEAMRDFDLLVGMMRDRVAFAEARRRIEEDGLHAAYEELDLPFVPENSDVWDLACALNDYDPRSVLERIEIPVLAVFGADDEIVPVEESIAVYRSAVSPDLLTVAIIEGGGHRLVTGEPPVPMERYLETLSSFVASATR